MNAAFIANLSDCGDELTDAKLVFGGVSASFHRACRTEEYLSGRKINSNDTLKGESWNMFCYFVILLSLFNVIRFGFCDKQRAQWYAPKHEFSAVNYQQNLASSLKNLTAKQPVGSL